MTKISRFVWWIETWARVLLSIPVMLIGVLIILIGFRSIGVPIYNFGVSMSVDAALIARDKLSDSDEDYKEFDDHANNLSEDYIMF